MTPAARAHLEAGLAAHQARDFRRAAAAYQAALAIAPADPDALHLYGVALLELGQAEEAVSYLKRAAHKYRNNAQVIGNLGQCYIALKRYDEAEAAFRKASRIDAANPQYQIGLAASLALQSKLADAEALLRRVAARFPALPLVWLNLGHVLLDRGELDEASAVYRKVLALDAGSVEAQNNIGRAHQGKLELDQAEAAYRRCIEMNPEYWPAYLNVASVAIDRGRFRDGENFARHVVARAPQMFEAHLVLASAVGHQGRLRDAHPIYRRMLELAPGDPKTQASHATSLLETGHANEGLRAVTDLLRTGRLSPAARQTFGAWLLSNGQLRDGWAEYLQRPAALRIREKFQHLSPEPTLPADCSGKHICVLREQGLGDELFFLRYAPALAARGARITYRAHHKITPLLTRAPVPDDVLDETLEPPPPADHYILVGDLPHALGASASSDIEVSPTQAHSRLLDYARAIRLYWPRVPPSLRIEPLLDRVESIRAQLARFGPAPYIGVTWRGGVAPEDQKMSWVLYKEIGRPALAQTLARVRGTLVALQRKPAPAELEHFGDAAGRPVHDMTALNDDLEAMHALLALLDDYVGVSNTNMHMRAALGRTARVLVPQPAEWRWTQFGRESPWFPGFSIYRQSLNGDWSRALSKLRDDLHAAHGTT